MENEQTKRPIYFDNNATTIADKDVFEEMIRYFASPSNPGVQHSFGIRSREIIKTARERTAALLNADPEEIIFTSGGTESNNLALRSMCNSKLKGKCLVVSTVEHDSILSQAEFIKEVHGIDVKYVGVDRSGVVKLDDLKNICEHNDVGMVSIMYVNNETGSKNPVKDIASYCRSKGIIFHTDCVQAISTEKIDVKDMQLDMVSISGHKIHAGKGTGALYVRKDLIEEMTPVIFGGTRQEFGVRGGTENVASITCFGLACKNLKDNFEEESAYVSNLKHEFYSELIKEAKLSNIDYITAVNGESPNTRGKTLNIRFDGVHGETLMAMLSANNVFVSTGSACTGWDDEPSHVLMAMGLSSREAKNSIRISFSKYNNIDDIHNGVKIIVDCVKKLLNGR